MSRKRRYIEYSPVEVLLKGGEISVKQLKGIHRYKGHPDFLISDSTNFAIRYIESEQYMSGQIEALANNEADRFFDLLKTKVLQDSHLYSITASIFTGKDTVSLIFDFSILKFVSYIRNSDTYMAQEIVTKYLPHLIHEKDVITSWPICKITENDELEDMSREEWEQILSDIIKAFKAYTVDFTETEYFDEEDRNIIEDNITKGLKFFSLYFAKL